MGKPRRPTPAPAAAKRKGAGGKKQGPGGAGAKGTKGGSSQKHKQQHAASKAKGKGKPKPAAPPVQHDEEEEEYEVGEEDLAFLEEHAGFASAFIDSNPMGEAEKGKHKAKQQPPPPAPPKRKQPEAQAQEEGDWDEGKRQKKGEEASGEQPPQEQQEGEAAAATANGKAPRGRKPSTQGWDTSGANVQVKERLPVKTIDGKLLLRTEEVPVEEDEEGEEEPAPAPQEAEVAAEESESEEEEEDYDDVGSDSDVSASEVLSRGRMSLAAQGKGAGAGGGREEMAGKYSAAAEGLSLRAFGGDARALRRARLELKKVEIATLCEAVLEDPETGLMRKVAAGSSKGEDDKGKGKPGGPGRTRMATLLTLMEDDDVRVQGLAMLSLLAVFRDVAPSYRIRLPTEKELAIKVSKDVQRTRDYERSLLGAYQAYLKHLEHTCRRARLIVPPGGGWKGGKGKGKKGGGSEQDQAAGLAAKCLCELLAALPHFNFTTNVLAAVVRLGLGPDAAVREEAARAVRRLLERDQQGDVSLTAAKLVAKEAQSRKLQCPDPVVRALQALKLRVTEDEAEELLRKRGGRHGHGRHGGGKKHGGRQEEEEGEEDEDGEGGIRADILAGLKEAEARADPELRARCQAEALQEVTVLYFRVLKHRPEKPKAGGSLSLLPAALEGLSKVAHLINLDTVVDLMDVLKELLDPERRLPLQASLHAVLTALRTLQGPGRELKVDDKAFVAFLYQQLRRVRNDMVVVAPTPSTAKGAADQQQQSQQHQKQEEGVLPLLATCLRAALVERREYSLARVAAFYKQLCSLALQLPGPKEARVALALAQELAGRYPGLDQMLDAEADRVAMGVYKPDALEPEMSNPLATGAWELALLRCHHHHPRIRQAAAAVVAATRSSTKGGAGGGGVRDPLAALKEQEDLAQRGFGGVFTRMPKANPLHGMVRRAEREKKGRKDKVKLFFVQRIVRPELLTADGERLLQGVPGAAGAAAAAAEEGECKTSFKPFYREAKAHQRKVELCEELAGIRGAVAKYRKHQKASSSSALGAAKKK